MSVNIYKNRDISSLYNDNREYIFSIIFYLTGLIIGSLFYCKADINDLILSIINSKNATLLSLFISRLSVYISIYCITLLLGMCLIGFPFISIIPLMIGLELGIKLSYYYVSYKAKGIGYSLLLIIPELSAFFTILIYTMKSSNKLSKSIYDLSTKKSDTETIELNQYLKSYAIYSVFIILISFINALMEFLLAPIININS